MFPRYEHKGTWSESISIFLFVNLILKKQNPEAVSISKYQYFELNDRYIELYNEWIVDEGKNNNLVKEWITKYRQEVDQFRDSFSIVYKPKVELWSDRKKNQYFKTKLQDGFEFENFIADILLKKFNLKLGQFLTSEGQYRMGENELGIEIKNDTLIRKYGNIYIEYAEKSGGNNKKYVRSGILKKDNTRFFLIGDKNKFWIFKKAKLIKIFLEEWDNIKNNNPSLRNIKFKQKPTSLGFVFPVKYAVNEAISIEEMVVEIKGSI